MKWYLWLRVCGVMAILVVGGFLIAGCKKPATAPAPPPAAVTPGLPTMAQPKLKTMKLWIGAKAMTAELALTPIQQETGMMFRTNMGPDEGMLFVFDQPQRAAFWMMNTILPLSAAYISPEGEILEIHALTPHDTNVVVAASFNVQYVLETPQGWFESNHVPVGTIIATDQGPLKRVFFGAR